MKKYLALGMSGLLFSASSFATEEDIIGQLMGAVDTSTLMGIVASLGVVAVGIKFGEKGITFVKRLVGKV